ncbi:uncharacterized protein P174DRAFT_267451 [Aspergillus novofumigatus IBT 16806]|uniref:Uncharacterized protein n=1 Tax=Aspergillus novofumigatus (strain IBT 16806) TaxID=1392255 RepID=A0A2I1BZ07_ASPN1|nr:uncharacterized protein P174DRAFT_267451 [Aspergillus novofumigatus IBT 16806]PKX90616.1 hypothetical protein P174DRAFT_267451 [Aspergillus novofumigatus IBT 16806]
MYITAQSLWQPCLGTNSNVECPVLLTLISDLRSESPAADGADDAAPAGDKQAIQPWYRGHLCGGESPVSSSSEDPIAPVRRRRRVVAASEPSSSEDEGPALASLNSLSIGNHAACHQCCPRRQLLSCRHFARGEPPACRWLPQPCAALGVLPRLSSPPAGAEPVPSAPCQRCLKDALRQSQVCACVRDAAYRKYKRCQRLKKKSSGSRCRFAVGPPLGPRRRLRTGTRRVSRVLSPS